MTKEEIREGLADIFSTLEGGRGGANYKLADEILSYLHKNDVVIKVKEFPTPWAFAKNGDNYACGFNTCLSQVEEVVEPLI